MPLVKCQVNGRLGWKWGRDGKCYVGKNAKKRALQQMKAILAAESKTEDYEKEQS